MQGRDISRHVSSKRKPGPVSSQLSWNIQKTIPNIPVPTLESGSEFYALLGFEQKWAWPSEDAHMAGLLRGDMELMLMRCEPAAPAAVYFLVDDVQKCYDEITGGLPWEKAADLGELANRDDCPPQRALTKPDPPSDKEYGYRDFTIVDPWGSELTFGGKA